MALKTVTDLIQGNQRIVTIEGDNWGRIVIIITKGDEIIVEPIDDDTNRLYLEVIPKNETT